MNLLSALSSIILTMSGYNVGNRNPPRQQGVIDTKVLLDFDLVSRFQENGRTPAQSGDCFADGSNEMAHNAMEGDTWLLNRQTMIRSPDMTGYMQTGIVAVNGLRFRDYASQMEMDSDWKFGGINQTKQRLQKSEYGQTDSTNQSSTSFIVGKLNICWNSTKPVFAGDMVTCGLPWAPFHPDANKDSMGGFNGYRIGTVPRSLNAVYEPYVPTDLSVQVAGGAAALQLDKANNGINGVSYDELYPADGKHRWSSEQEVAIALKYGLWGVALSFMRTLANSGRLATVSSAPDVDQLAEEVIGNLQDDLTLTAVHDLILNMADPQEPRRAQALSRIGGVNGLYEYKTNRPAAGNSAMHLQAHAMEILFGGLAAAQDHKRSKIVGMACGNAQPGEDVAILFGYHTK